MPFSKEKNRRIYITAFVISFFLIVGSIYLHLRQKTHLGRMSFNLDRDRIKPTSGVDLEATSKSNDYDSKYKKKPYAYDYSDEDNDILEEESSADNNNDDTIPSNFEQFDTDDDIEDESEDDIGDSNEMDNIDANNDKMIDDYSATNIIDDIDDISESERTDSDFCLRCLCMTINECHTTQCSENPCGLYKISKLYWIDSGKPTIAGGSIDNEDQDYLTCVNDDTCSATTIRHYFNRFKKDCNNDGKLDCEDLILLHFMGPSGCLSNRLGYLHKNRMNKCFNETNFSYSFSEEEY
ncbi:uncharacterized protein ACRADG_002345 [Cochliomyia hominivorax]